MPPFQLGPARLFGHDFSGLPVTGAITARFGSREIPEHAKGHSGVDIAAPVGTAVLAPAPGLVVAAEHASSVFGWHVVVRHVGGFVSLYAHLSRIDVRQGQQVARGDGLGLVGLTGLTTGPHLHWGLAFEGSPLVAGPHLRDPLAFIAAAPVEVERERLYRGIALALLGLLQTAGATLNTQTADDFDAFAAGSPERQLLAVQEAANAFIARLTQ